MIDVEKAKAAALALQRCSCWSCGECIETLCEELMSALGITDEEAKRNMEESDE